MKKKIIFIITIAFVTIISTWYGLAHYTNIKNANEFKNSLRETDEMVICNVNWDELSVITNKQQIENFINSITFSSHEIMASGHNCKISFKSKGKEINQMYINTYSNYFSFDTGNAYNPYIPNDYRFLSFNYDMEKELFKYINEKQLDLGHN